MYHYSDSPARDFAAWDAEQSEILCACGRAAEVDTGAEYLCIDCAVMRAERDWHSFTDEEKISAVGMELVYCA